MGSPLSDNELIGVRQQAGNGVFLVIHAPALRKGMMIMRNIFFITIGLSAISVAFTFQQTAASEPERLEEIVVRAQELPSRGTALTRASLEDSGALNVGQVATDVPGVDGVYRGANAAEPVIRGLGWERVETQMGCLPLYGACPARMDPPASYVSPEALESVQIVKGLPSVTLGPGGTGGRLILSSDYDRGEDAGNDTEGGARVTWDEGRDGFTAGIHGKGGTPNMDYRIEGNAADLDDYESADGKTIPAGLEEVGASLSLGWRPAEGARLYGGILYKEEENVDFPALPMDIEDSTAYIATLGYRFEREGDTLEGANVELGYSEVDHLMSNRNKPNRKMMQARTPSDAISFAGKLSTDWRLSEDALLTLGTDYGRLERDALRQRRMVATGMILQDHIWPDVSRDIAGGFGELNIDVSGTLSLRIGARVDYAQSEAKAADDRIVLGMGSPPSTVRDQYVRFYGPDAADVDNNDVLVSGNVLLEWQASEAILVFAGAGKINRAPSVTEQYFAFAPAPGGFLVGDPSLDAEDKYEISAGAQLKKERVAAELSLFASEVSDYIYQTSIDRIDVDGDGTVDSVRGFRNVDAELYGGEAAATFLLAEGLTAPLSISYVRGKNKDDDGDLPEIPPFGGKAAVKYEAGESHPWWCEAGVRFAARQDKVDATFPEDETASFEVFHLRGGVELFAGWELEVGVENLFDEDYNEHLTREALMHAGDLAAGDEVSAPGRFVYVTAKMAL